MAVADIYELTLGYRVKGEYVENVLHYREKTAETALIPAQELALGFQAAVIPGLVALLSNQAVLSCIYVRRISPTAGVTHTELLSDAGEVVSEAIPSASALVISWYGALAGDRRRGRTYLAGLPETAQAGGSITDAARAAFQAFANDMLVDLAAGGAGVGVWELATWSQVGLHAEVALVATVRTNLAQQRRRRQRPGVA